MATAQPPFRAQMLKEGNKAVTIIMIALSDRQCAGDRLGPAIVIDKARVSPELAELAGRSTLIDYDGRAIGDVRFLVDVRDVSGRKGLKCQ